MEPADQKKLHELIAAMKSDRFNGDMAIEALELLANQEPPAAADPSILEAVHLKVEAAELKIESLEIRLKSLEDKDSQGKVEIKKSRKQK